MIPRINRRRAPAECLLSGHPSGALLLYINNVRARGIVFVGRSKRAELIYRYMVAWVELYRMAKKAIWLCKVTSIRLLLRIGIKVVDEWQISLDYVRGR